MIRRRPPEIFRDTRRMRHDFPGLATFQVRLEEQVRVIKIREHQIEIADVIHPRRIEHRAWREERAERAVIYRAHRIEIITVQRDFRQSRMSEHFDVRVRPALAEQPQRRQCHDEVTECPTHESRESVSHDFYKHL